MDYFVGADQGRGNLKTLLAGDLWLLRAGLV
jgi:hypothetical protein